MKRFIYYILWTSLVFSPRFLVAQTQEDTTLQKFDNGQKYIKLHYADYAKLMNDIIDLKDMLIELDTIGAFDDSELETTLKRMWLILFETRYEKEELEQE